MVLMGPISSRVDFSPQGLFEKVLTPRVVHSQIWPLSTAGSGVAGTGDAGGAGSAAAGRRVPSGRGGAVVASRETGNDGPGAAAIAGGCRLKVEDDLVETAVMASATPATNKVPRIHGSRSRSLFTDSLSSPRSGAGGNSPPERGPRDRQKDATPMLIYIISKYRNMLICNIILR
jgi:hypothetical protein